MAAIGLKASHEIRIGRCFLHPLLDYLLIGGGLSLPVVLYVLLDPSITPKAQTTRLMVFVFFNFAHFAASSVRLYTLPDSLRTFRILCFGFPVVALGVLTLAVLWPEVIGRHLWALFLTWSPYHYAAQTYGLALMYCFRSGCRLSSPEKQLLWWISMLPFLRALLSAPEAGLAWFLPNSVIESQPILPVIRDAAVQGMTVLIFILPLWLYHRTDLRMPLISLLLLVSNGIWWIALSYTDAWFWATVFHAIQYLVIVMVMHVSERMSSAENQDGPLHHATMFYATSLLLGMALFLGLPALYGVAGLSGEKTALLVAAAISIHHFAVDGYIWRSKKREANPAIT